LAAAESLRFEDVVAGYGAETILHGLSFSVPGGALTTVIGPNGAGKSTAFKAAFGMLPGVDRPALAATVPTPRRPAVLLDVGASVESRPHHLLQFAVMGSVYARIAFGLERPRVGLLSIGEEATKGNELTREAHRLLKASPLAFCGNVEARDVYTGQADVIVCDGFTGNVALKISEGLVEVVETMLTEELSSTITMRVGSLLTRRALRRFDSCRTCTDAMRSLGSVTRSPAHGTWSPRTSSTEDTARTRPLSSWPTYRPRATNTLGPR